MGFEKPKSRKAKKSKSRKVEKSQSFLSAFRRFGVSTFCVILCVSSVGTAVAQSADESAQTPLATKQQIIHDRVLRLEDQMYRLIEKLRTEEPKPARRLEKALARMGELGVRQQLKQIIEILNEDRLELAVDEQSELLDTLSALLTLLIEDTDDGEQRKEEIERLEQLVQQLDQLIAEENKLKASSQSTEEAMQGFQPDTEAAAAIEHLLGEQETLHSDTQDKYFKRDTAKTADELTTRQRELTEKAEQLAKMLREKDETASAKLTESAKLNMADATEEMSEDAYGASSDAQEDAIEDLKRALANLTKRPTDGADQPDFEALSKSQAQTGEKTGKLTQQMRENDPGSSEPTPGQDNVEMSKQHMDAATRELDQQNPSTAQTRQQQAIEQLEQAKSQIQRKIDQLKRELQEQKLADLEKKFKDMLLQQQAINRRTIELDNIPQVDRRRQEQLRAVEQSRNQHHLGELADVCLHILIDDGTTTVLPQLVEYLRDDMYAVARRLDDFQVGPPTQAAQSDIVATIEDILDSIQQNQQRSGQNQNQPQQGEPCEPPLLPPSAELKLLANLQERVFRQTRAYHRVGDEDLEQLGRITKKQSDVAQMASAMSNKLKRNRPQPPEQPPTDSHD